jgi:hypothetical protein
LDGFVSVFLPASMPIWWYPLQAAVDTWSQTLVHYYYTSISVFFSINYSFSARPPTTCNGLIGSEYLLMLQPIHDEEESFADLVYCMNKAL